MIQYIIENNNKSVGFLRGDIFDGDAELTKQFLKKCTQNRKTSRGIPSCRHPSFEKRRATKNPTTQFFGRMLRALSARPTPLASIIIRSNCCASVGGLSDSRDGSEQLLSALATRRTSYLSDEFWSSNERY